MRFDSQETDPTFNIRVVKTDAQESDQVHIQINSQIKSILLKHIAR